MGPRVPIRWSAELGESRHGGTRQSTSCWASVKYDYENMSPKQFEDVVVSICHDLLGAAVQGFAEGPDGGRDAKFVGTAERYPSTAGPWVGTVVVQAKHTSGLNKKFTDSDFFSKTAVNAKSTVLGEEIPRIKRLRDSKKLDHYMLFSNRRLTGEGESAIRETISKQCGVPEASICVAGVEVIERWLKAYPDAAGRAGIDAMDFPLIVSPDELASVVEALAKQIDSIEPDTAPVDRVLFAQKNERNNMTLEYARLLLRNYLKDSRQIQSFLADPLNQEVLGWYVAAAEEFQLKIVAKRGDFRTFDNVMNYLWDLLFKRDSVLRDNQRLTRILVFYMYWNCDIGDDGDSDAADD